MGIVGDADILSVSAAGDEFTTPALGACFIACFRADVFPLVHATNATEAIISTLAGLLKASFARFACRASGIDDIRRCLVVLGNVEFDVRLCKILQITRERIDSRAIDRIDRASIAACS